MRSTTLSEVCVVPQAACLLHAPNMIHSSSKTRGQDHSERGNHEEYQTDISGYNQRSTTEMSVVPAASSGAPSGAAESPRLKAALRRWRRALSARERGLGAAAHVPRAGQLP
mmetsp:Transcript_898/g.1495  ORF Transcript_898/g.1495 Transcript_898/m.1495 type:complete len:112 (+) Transcript_898:346-681(+)